MLLCQYGCGNPGTFQFKNGTYCCAKRFDGCPVIIKKRIDTRKSKNWKHSEESKKKIGDKSRGRTLSVEWRRKISASEKGKSKGPKSEETKRKQSEAMKGKPAWNKGLTLEDPRVAAYVRKQTGQHREGNYVSPTNWQGEGNPWFGKSRSKENSPRYNGEEYNRELQDYRNKVSWLTEQTYAKYTEVINPNNKLRTLAGVEEGSHLDHIYPVSKGFDNNIPPELIASIENLRLINWRENVIKSNAITEELIPPSIKEYLARIQ
jgi:hypothetical protein